jgi:hypothetical protein
MGNGRGKSNPAAKAGGHGDHWGCIFRNVEEDVLLNLIEAVVSTDAQPERFGPGMQDSAYRSAGERLRVCVLVEGKDLISAYPEAHGGAVWPITVREVVPWANGLEGQITGDCNGAIISFFDTRFSANGHKYAVGQTYDFEMGALAYTLEPATELEGVSDELGTKVSFKGACAYMPAGMGNEHADIDDLWFRSPLDGAIEQVDLEGKRLSIYPITIAIPEHFEMNLPLYAAEHVLGAGMEGIKRGDDVEGFLWLQGHLREA